MVHRNSSDLGYHPYPFGDRVRGRSERGGLSHFDRLKTNVYIDGFNFYYRCVKGTPYKWLDFSKLCALLLPSRSSSINRIRYFTARVKPFPDNPDAPIRQQVYLRALSTIPNLQITYGHSLTNEVSMRLVAPPAGGSKWARVIKTEEKGSDVNIATYLLLDAFRGDCQAAMIISNDSDLVEPIRVIKTEFGIKILLVVPPRKPSAALVPLADLSKPSTW